LFRQERNQGASSCCASAVCLGSRVAAVAICAFAYALWKLAESRGEDVLAEQGLLSRFKSAFQ
jgi:hypothetical protein